MVNRHPITIALSVALSGVTVANNCLHGYYYCGSSLLQKGNYYDDIVKSLSDAKQPNDEAHVNQSLFYCKGDDDVPFVQYCGNGCHDAGSKKSDSCN